MGPVAQGTILQWGFLGVNGKCWILGSGRLLLISFDVWKCSSQEE